MYTSHMRERGRGRRGGGSLIRRAEQGKEEKRKGYYHDHAPFTIEHVFQGGQKSERVETMAKVTREGGLRCFSSGDSGEAAGGAGGAGVGRIGGSAM